MPQRDPWVVLPRDEMPNRWYNILPDLPEPLPPPRDHPESKVGVGELSRILPRTVLRHESSQERFVRIPEEVWEAYALVGRPRPLHRAYRLERLLRTPARIYFKREDLSPTGSHKLNHAIPQAYYAREEGYERVVTETGAVQWGPALAYAAALFGLRCRVYVVRTAYEYKVERRTLIELLGAEAVPSPSPYTEVGRRLMETRYEGSLGIAISEAAEDALSREDTVYPVGSVLNAVLMYATINGMETKAQLEMVDEKPDVMIGCFGGGSNFGGLVLPFVGDVLRGKAETRFVAVQAGVERLRTGEYRYDFVDEGKVLPQFKNLTHGLEKHIPLLYAEGLRYHASSPLISYLVTRGLIEPAFYPPEQEPEILRTCLTVFRTEGFLPAPESCYAVKAAVDEALRCKETREEKVIVANVSGHGYLDLRAYRDGAILGRPAEEALRLRRPEA